MGSGNFAIGPNPSMERPMNEATPTHTSNLPNSATGIRPFDFEGLPVRISDREGEPWFVLADTCRVLEIGNPSDAARRLDDDEKDALDIIDPMGRPQRATVINESGLYSLILTSRKEAAKRFKTWVTKEVLPSIRKTGSYNAPDPIALLNDPAAMRGLLLTYSEKVLSLEAKVGDMQPSVDALDRLADAHGSLCITDAAKNLQVPPRVLFRWLRENGWIYRRVGVNFDIAYQSKISAGYLIHKVEVFDRADGTEGSRTQVRVTPRGLTVLAKAFPPAAAEVSNPSRRAAFAGIAAVAGAIAGLLPAPATKAAPSALDRDGLAIMRIDGRQVTVDTARYKLEPGQTAVVFHWDGHMSIEPVQNDGFVPWYGQRAAATDWHDPQPSDLRGAVKSRHQCWVVGAVVE